RLLNRAIELDPEFASAYAMAAYCCGVRTISGWVTSRDNETAEAVRMARRAAELGKDDAVALAASGLILAHRGRDLDPGVALVDRALTLNPNLALAWYWCGWLKIWLGEPDAAIERLARAMRLSPLDPNITRMQNAVAHAHFHAERYEEASSWAAMVLQE